MSLEDLRAWTYEPKLGNALRPAAAKREKWDKYNEDCEYT